MSTYRDMQDKLATEFFVLREVNFYNRSAENSIDVDYTRSYKTRAEAERVATAENEYVNKPGTIYYLSHNEYSPPSFFVVADNERIAGKRWQNFYHCARETA